MELTTQQQTTAFLLAFLMGAVLCAGYMVLSVLRKLSPPGKIALFAGDTVWMMSAAVINFLFAVSQTDGKIRFYVLAAELISFLLLWMTLGRLLMKGTEWVRTLCIMTGIRVKTIFLSFFHKIWTKLVGIRGIVKLFEKK